MSVTAVALAHGAISLSLNRLSLWVLLLWLLTFDVLTALLGIAPT